MIRCDYSTYRDIKRGHPFHPARLETERERISFIENSHKFDADIRLKMPLYLDRHLNFLIEVSRKGAQGMLSQTESRRLFILASCISPGNIIEIGTNCGYSSLFLAAPGNYVFTMDPHIPLDLTKPNPTPFEKYLLDISHGESTYERAKEVWKICGLSNRINGIVGYSYDVANDLPDNVDMIFIDGNHEAKAVEKDLQIYLPKLRSGGILCMHDWGRYDFNYKDGMNIRKPLSQYIKTGRVEHPCVELDSSVFWAIKK